MKVDLHAAKSQLLTLGRLVWEGREIVIAKGGEPWLRLGTHNPEQTRRRRGTLRGKIRIAPDFDKTLPAVTQLFEGSVVFSEQEN